MKTTLSLLSFLVVFSAHSETLINGAGATFPYPLYSKWISEFGKANPAIRINYQSIGSGGGQRQLLDGIVDFAGSDAPMADDMLSKSKVPLLHLPTTLGAVALGYHLPGIQNLRLDSGVLVEILMGKIKKWSDPKIQALNPGAKLPDLPVFIVYRSDGSGTTYVFTDYLSKVSPDWKEKVGVSTSVKWPVGIGGKGNDGVSALIKQTPGALGYIEMVYAKSNSISVAQIKNPAGSFVSPEVKNVTAAASGFLKSIPDDFRISITNAPGKESYPISSFTYFLVPTQWSKEKGTSFQKFLVWAMGEGQKFCAPLDYAPLPSVLVPKVLSKIKKIEIK